jgi:hypothetical protein
MPATKSSQQRPPAEPLSFIVALLAILALAACVAFTWWRLRYDSYSTEVKKEFSTRQQAASQKQRQDGLPTLKLNQDNERQGPAVTVDPNLIGKDNPFQ